MKVVSLFDGMSCGQIALNRLGITNNEYYASEIDRYAMKITQKNFPHTIQVGDVEKVSGRSILNAMQAHDYERPVDLLMGGSPCQGFSFAGKRLDFEDPRSKLFFEFVRLKKELQPTYFLLENVRMNDMCADIISNYLGVEPLRLNSNLVSAQNRFRLYWTNIPGVHAPTDQEIMLRDIILPNTLPVVMHNLYGGFKETRHRTFIGKSPTIRTAAGGGHIPSLLHTDKAIDYMNRKVAGGRNHWDFGHHSDTMNDKSATVVANFFKGVPYNVLRDRGIIRKFDPVECERLQTVPDNYTAGVSNTQRYRMIGNGWTVDMIAHILKNIGVERYAS